MRVEQREDGKWYVVDASGNTVGTGWLSEALATRAMTRAGGSPAAPSTTTTTPTAETPATVQGDPTVANNVAGLFDNIANTVNTVIGQSAPQSQAGAGDFAATNPQIVKQAKDGQIPASEAYATLRVNGASMEEAVAYMAARGVYYTPPPENTGAPGNVGGASGGTGGASGGGSAGGGGTGLAGGSAAPLSRRDQLKAALNAGLLTQQDYDGQIQALNREERDAIVQQGEDAAKEYAAKNPDFVWREGTRVENASTGRSFEMVYSDKFGYELKEVQGIQTPGSDPYGTNAVKANALKTSAQYVDGNRQTMLGEVSPAMAARLATMGPTERVQELYKLTGRIMTPTEQNAFLGTSVGGYNGAIENSVVQQSQLGNVEANSKASFLAAGLSPEDADFRAKVQFEAAKYANALAPPQQLNEFGQPITATGDLESPLTDEALGQMMSSAQEQAASRGIKLTSSPQGFTLIDANGNSLNLGAYDTAEEAWRAYMLQLRRKTEEAANARQFQAQPLPMSAAQNRSVNNLGSSAFGGNPNQGSSAYPGPRPGGGGAIPPVTPPPTGPYVPAPIPVNNGPTIYQPPFPGANVAAMQAAPQAQPLAPVAPVAQAQPVTPYGAQPLPPVTRRRRKLTELDELERIVA